MMTTAPLYRLDADVIGSEAFDKELVRGILAGVPNAKQDFAILMHGHAQRIYRVCRSVVANDAEAVAAVQEAFLRAYRHLDQFSGNSTFAAWLTKIAIYEALLFRRPSHNGEAPRVALRPQLVTELGDLEERPRERDSARLLEEAIDSLPPNFRTVYVLRRIEKLSADETSNCLLLSREAVDARLERAIGMLQKRLPSRVLDQPVEHVFPFRDARYTGLIDRVAERIMERAG